MNSKTAHVIKKGAVAEVKDHMPRTIEKAHELKTGIKDDIKSNLPANKQ